MIKKICKFAVPGLKLNYESAGKEGRWRTLGFPLNKPIVKIGFVIFQDILIILL